MPSTTSSTARRILLQNGALQEALTAEAMQRQRLMAGKPIEITRADALRPYNEAS